MSRSAVIVSTVVIALVAVCVGYLVAPKLWARAVPGYLNENIGSFLVVDESSFAQSPPSLILKGVHLQNPQEFGPGDAVTIDEINVVFDSFSRDPMLIKAVTVKKIKGTQVVRNNRDNFSAVHKLLMDRRVEIPRGELANTVKLDKFVIYDSVVQNEDGSVMKTLPNRNLTPTGAMANNPPLQNVIVDILGMVVEQQYEGTSAFVVEAIKDKANETIKSLGDSLKTFLTTP